MATKEEVITECNQIWDRIWQLEQDNYRLREQSNILYSQVLAEPIIEKGMDVAKEKERKLLDIGKEINRIESEMKSLMDESESKQRKLYCMKNYGYRSRMGNFEGNFEELE
jgi:hypothetical protein